MEKKPQIDLRRRQLKTIMYHTAGYQKAHKKGYPKRKRKKMANQWEETTKGAITKEFFSKCKKNTDSESKLKTKCNNNYERRWKYLILLTSIKSYRKPRVPMQQTRYINSRPSVILVQKARERKRNCEKSCT